MMRNLLIFIVSLFFLTACSSTSNHQLDDETLSNEDTMSKSVEGKSSLETSKDTNAETSVESSHESIVNHQPLTNHELNPNLDSNKDSIVHANAEPESGEPSQVAATETSESDAKSGGEKGIGSYFIRHNQPTKTVIKSLEGVTDALNVMTFGIFATGHG
ncbi:putative periplasmic lipoprotein [Vibrio crassostreae]|uniref:hypothetical protein n=1 Tax=Vibrio crassostreae TaxID=246167 RepID=UPI0006314940|nr:hypothetical protein [Vibrio crassostreae]TCN99845.1 hypothetical protein EDB30_113127 [Vibrio crassostreae]TCT51037.1 hypothetical protein EDB42_107212 [Vibrio crassostreae]TCT65158.1 hypothetical protein EDB31_12311 [Vibrio crassostreae]TCT75706.1 hypothetical protein EDB41_107212 [Vibrio crassostreae]TCT95071.1 hypothetical protein EDB38_107212 [Vibrio crassostreae]